MRDSATSGKRAREKAEGSDLSTTKKEEKEKIGGKRRKEISAVCWKREKGENKEPKRWKLCWDTLAQKVNGKIPGENATFAAGICVFPSPKENAIPLSYVRVVVFEYLSCVRV